MVSMASGILSKVEDLTPKHGPGRPKKVVEQTVTTFHLLVSKLLNIYQSVITLTITR